LLSNHDDNDDNDDRAAFNDAATTNDSTANTL
jgi:hypothetical protein